MATLMSTSVLIFIGFLAILLTSFIIWLMKRHYKHQLFKRYGIPGPKPNLITGNVNELLSAETPNAVITEWIKKYGKIVGYYVGGNPRMIVNDPVAIKTIFVKKFFKFFNRERMALETGPLLHTVLYLRNDKWKRVRSILTPTFSGAKIRQMTEVMNKKVDKMLEIIEDFSSKHQPFDMYIRVQGLTLDVIGECALALKVNCQEDPQDELLVAVRDFFRYSNNSAVRMALYFPPLKFLMEFIGNYLTAGKMTSLIVENVEKVIAYRRAHNGPKAIDLLQLMLDASEEQNPTAPKLGDKKKFLTDTEIVSNAYIFLLAGYETTATALAFAFYLLAKHQDIQERLYEEVSSKISLRGNHHPSYEDILNLEYLDKVFSESLRYYPPVTGFISRECNEECEINGFRVPEGVVVQADIWDIQHDPEIWPDPWKFDPERFAPDKKYDLSVSTFFPFGLGQRNCIGMRFAQIEAKLAIARTILNYKLVFSEQTDDPLPLICPTVIINPKNGIILKAIKR